MGYNSAYNNPSYRKLQSDLVRKAWSEGKFNSLIKPPKIKQCLFCGKIIAIKVHRNKTKYCSISCAAIVNNAKRGPISPETGRKISKALKGKQNPYKGIRKVQYIALVCGNPSCKKSFELPPYLAKTHKYCSILCAMKVIGSLTTSPKASKGKSGVRLDIDQNINFYSTWEANIARVFILLGMEWEYAPTVFNLDGHTYRPDFYLPEYDTYVEVKNFMNDYSRKRDELFRRKYPLHKLELILKEEYKEIESNYRELLLNWES